MGNHAIIVGAGKGARLNSPINKILLCLDENPIIYHTIKIFEESHEIDSIILVCNKDDINIIRNLVNDSSFQKVKHIVEGGKERQDSVYNGIKSLNANPDDIILIHNAANPFTDKKLISEIILSAEKFCCAVCGFPSENTIKEISTEGFVEKTLDRKKLFQIQTPQAAKYKVLKESYEKAYKENFYSTDDASILERYGQKVKLVLTSKENFKITTQADLEYARLIKNSVRVGIGQDSHKFSEKPKKLILGGIHIPDENGLEGNSDADVILHTVLNALSNSIGGNSLGFYADEMCKNGIIDSKEYLKPILKEIKEKEYKINSIGISIEGKKPKFRKYEDAIKKSIAGIFGITSEKVGFNATTGEELTSFGRGEALMCYAVVSLGKE